MFEKKLLGLLEKWGKYIGFLTAVAGLIGYFADIKLIPYFLLCIGWLLISYWLLTIWRNPKSSTGLLLPNSIISPRVRKRRIAVLISFLLVTVVVWFPIIQLLFNLPRFTLVTSPKDKFVIVVARFSPKSFFPVGSSTSDDIQQRLVDDLDRMVVQQNLQDKIIIVKYSTINSAKNAENIGHRINADVVVWGTTSLPKSNLMTPNFTFLIESDELTSIDPILFNMQVSGENSDGMLTNRARAVTCFLFGLYYLDSESPDDYVRARYILDQGIAEAEIEYKTNTSIQNDLAYNLALLYFTRGRALAALNEKWLAKSDFEKALEYKGNFLRAYSAIGNLYYTQDSLWTAQSYYEEAETEWHGLYGLGLVSFRWVDYGDAIKYFTQSLNAAIADGYSLDGNIVMKTRYNLGMSYLMNGSPMGFEYLAMVCDAHNIPSNLKEMACRKELFTSLLTSTPEYLPTGSPVPTFPIGTLEYLPTGNPISTFPISTMEYLPTIVLPVATP